MAQPNIIGLQPPEAPTAPNMGGNIPNATIPQARAYAAQGQPSPLNPAAQPGQGMPGSTGFQTPAPGGMGLAQLLSMFLNPQVFSGQMGSQFSGGGAGGQAQGGWQQIGQLLRSILGQGVGQGIPGPQRGGGGMSQAGGTPQGT